MFLMLGVAFGLGRAWKDYSKPAHDFDFSKSGLSDFHAMYFYAKTFRLGLSPYEKHDREDLIVTRSSPPFSPVIFFVMLPLSYLPLAAADVAACLLNLAMIGGIALMVFRYSDRPVQWSWWLAVFGFLVFSRPGHITLHTGYFTALLVIGTLMAFHHAKHRPWLAAVGVLLASAKPTYIIPLLLILAFRKNYKAAVYGTILAVAVALAGITWLALAQDGSSFIHVIETVLHGQEDFHDDPTEEPVNTWTRIDILGMGAKIVSWKPGNGVYLIGMLVLLIPPGIAIRKASLHEVNSSATGLSAFIGILALLVTLYHHSYDCLLFALPWLALVLFGNLTLPSLSRLQRGAVGFLLLLPMINYASTLAFRNFLQLDQYSVQWQSITLINGVCLTSALLILMWAAWKHPTLDQQAVSVSSVNQN